MRTCAAGATAVVLGLAVAGAARADAPAVIPLQGTLAEADGRPVQGVRTLTFTIHDSETGGAPLWTETQDVAVVDGMLSTLVGESQPLDLALFRDNGVLWMEIAVDASPPFPRMQLGSTPYAAFAQYAGDARSVGGVAAGELARTGHEHDDRYYTEAELGAAGSASVHWGNLAGVPAGFADGVDSDTTYSAGLGLQLAGTRFSADPLYLEDRARAACYDTPAELQAELDSVYAPASHPTPWTTLTGVPAGFADGIDNDTTYGAGSGLSLSGTTFSVVFGSVAGTAAQGNDPRLSDARSPLPGSSSYIQNQSAAAQAASFWVGSSGRIGTDLTVDGQVSAVATWGLNARTQGLLVIPEGPVYDNGAGALTLGGTVIVMNPLGGSWIRVAAGTYTLGSWGYLFVNLPPTSARGTTIAPSVGTWSDADRPYDGRDRFILAQRAGAGSIHLNFDMPQTALRAPRTIFTPDPRGGCPPAATAGDLIAQTVNVPNGGTVHVTGRIISNTSGRRDLQLLVNGVAQVSNLGRTEVVDWLDHVVVWTGWLAPGTHTISIRTPNTTIGFGCGPAWGSITTIVFDR